MNAFRTILLFPWTVLKTLVLWPWKMLKVFLSGGRKLLLSARAWILFVVLVIALLVAYYVLSDLHTPFTTDAYVQAYVIQVAPRVEGQVVLVRVRENQAVTKGDLLFEIDRRPFQHRVDLLIAKRVNAVQAVAQLDADLSAARAEDARLVAEEAYARAVHEQEKAIYKQEATTDRKYLDAIQKYKAAQAALERSRAQVRKAEQALAAR
ncbi:MAG TPA: biotin/lipoyl-binding protein, partial [Gemmataceae bacterium]|nr:biotin/lipoyl-binding protein [Gemmataceae bacterium]